MQNVGIGVVWGLKVIQGNQQCHHLLQCIQLPIQL